MQFLKTTVEVSPTSPKGSTMVQYLPLGACDFRSITVIRGDRKRISETEWEDVAPYAFMEYHLGKETKRQEPLVLEAATKRKSVTVPMEVPMVDMEGKPAGKRPTQFFQTAQIVTYLEYNSPKIVGEDLKRLLAFLESNSI